MCFPCPISEVDFYDTQLPANELEEAIRVYEDKWIDEVYTHQRIIDRLYSEHQTCTLVKCLPKHLLEIFYAKYYKGNILLRADIKRITFFS
jgi:hypothetical protein